jgi:hypothetical protein
MFRPQRIATPLENSGAYPTLVRLADELATQLQMRGTEEAAALSARLTRLATEVKSWTPAARPEERRRQSVVQDLRVAILAAKPLLTAR